MCLCTPAIAGPKILIDMETGSVLAAEDADASWHPASLTKIMTAHLALKAIQNGELTFNTRIPISKHAASQPPSKLGLKAGSSIELRDALLVMLTRSANDIATAIGEAIGGTEEAFAALMTKEARLLGMSATVFKNANGLYEVEQVTTARDMAVLAMAVRRAHPEHTDMFARKHVTYGKRRFTNTNNLLGVYPGLEGMKTGYICASGFNIVATAERGEKSLLAVVLGEASTKTRARALTDLLDSGWSANTSNNLIARYAISKPSPATDLRQFSCGKTMPLKKSPSNATQSIERF